MNKNDTSGGQALPLIDEPMPFKPQTPVARSKSMQVQISDKKTIYQWNEQGQFKEVKVHEEPEIQVDEAPRTPSRFGSF